MPVRVRRLFGLPPLALDLLDAAAATVYDLLDETDRTWDDRLAQLPVRFERLFPDGVPEGRLDWLNLPQEEIEQKVKESFGRLNNPNTRRFLNRLLGSKTFNRLTVAFNQDWALFLLGTRRLLRSFMPVAQALQDAAGPLSDKERANLGGFSDAQTVLLDAVLKLDHAVGGFFDKRDIDLQKMGFPVRDAEARTLDVGVDELIDVMRTMLDVETQRRAQELSDVLFRKLRGFEQALAASDDGVSQAANSLVEFIDRLLRTAFDEADVLEWIGKHYPDDKSLVFEREGRAIPTKRASALCFAHAAQAPTETSNLESMVALSIVKVRSSAERLKHANVGDPDEEAELRRLMLALRGALTFILRFNWLLADDDRYFYLRERFAPQKAA
ncbi:hypothetical protein [Leifsonia poae]|uniref:hypothetical protein n=1 Tax=Leifsonia poae TaxID=110933 RepID=UPI001CBED70B|nr:hypothetical protein [Leifsonia poae]